MDKLNSKRVIFDSLKAVGFTKTANKRIFVRDCGFYFIVVELRPFHDQGFFLNVGVKFLWSSYYDISYDYSIGNIVINARDNPLGAITFESPTAGTEMEYVLTEAHKRIAEYLKLSDFAAFKAGMETRNDFAKIVDPDFEKKDINSAIVKMFSGEAQEAYNVLTVAAQNSDVAKSLSEHCDNIEGFKEDLINIINDCRRMMACKFKLSLSPVSRIWDEGSYTQLDEG